MGEIKSAKTIELFTEAAVLYERDVFLTEEEIDLILNADYEKNRLNWVGVSNKFLDTPGMESVKQFCNNCVQDYFTNLLKHNADLEIVTSWVNKTNPNEEHHSHFHSNSILSGVFYIDSVEYSPLRIVRPTVDHYSVNTESSNKFNSGGYKLYGQKNTCVVFKSSYVHHVLENKGTDPRYSVAFNAHFKKGQTIGQGLSSYTT